MGNFFSRTEMKYMLTREQYDAFKRKMADYLVDDEFHRYTICNIYYDDDDFNLFRRSTDKPLYKEKLRMRSYGTPKADSKVYIEVKKKFKGVVYKRRISMTLDEAYDFMSRNTGRMLEMKGGYKKKDISREEIRYLAERYQLKPKVYLSYDREAYSYRDDEDLRITFDTNMKYRLSDTGLEKGDYGDPILKEDLILMEIKVPGGMPEIMIDTMEELGIRSLSFSKIGTVYLEHILPGLKKAVAG